MSYFSYFPTTGYIVDAYKAKIVNVKNILIRAKFTDYIKTNSSVLTSYRLQEGDRPDTVANAIYGRSDLHWVVLMFNEILNPYHEWPLTQENLERMLDLLYPGTTLYVRDSSILSNKKTLDKNTPFFETNSTIYQTTSTGSSVSATVIKFNPNLGTLIVKDISGGEFETVTTNNGIKTLGVEISQTNSLGDSITATITKKELSLYAVHHFEDSEGNWLDSRCKESPIIGETYGVSYRPYSGIPKSIIQLYADSTIDPTSGLSTGVSLLVAEQAVRNIDYEYRTNENKREIKILQPKYLENTLNQFSDIFKNKNR